MASFGTSKKASALETSPHRWIWLSLWSGPNFSFDRSKSWTRIFIWTPPTTSFQQRHPLKQPSTTEPSKLWRSFAFGPEAIGAASLVLHLLGQATRTKLPTLGLAKCDGDRQNCLQFWNQFESEIHTNPELRPTGKFQYLGNLLSGKAASATSGMPPTEECYKDAIPILKQRFGDEALLVQDRMQALIEIKPVASSSDIERLRNLYDRVQVHCRSLKASMLREILLRTLPPDLVLRFHQWSKMAMTTTTNDDSSQQIDVHEKNFEQLS